MQITQPSRTLLTVNTGPPERSRTRSPLLSKGTARLCIVVLDCARPARAGTAHEVLTATPSIPAIAGTAFFLHILIAKPHPLPLLVGHVHPPPAHLSPHY